MKPYPLLLLLPLLLAQTLPTTAPSNLEAELTRLRTENARLRAELEKAKSQPTEPATTTPDKPRPFINMQAILKDTPADLFPKPTKEWAKYTAPKFDAWWRSQLVGMTIDQVLNFQGAYVSHSTNPRPGAEWYVNGIYFDSKSFTAFGADHHWSISVPSEQVDEAGAKKWDALKKGTPLHIKATIAAVDFSSPSYDNTKPPVYQIVLRLRDVEFIPPATR